MKIHRTFFLLAAGSLSLLSSLDARTWKEAGSERTVEGDYVRVEGDQVVIVRRSGQSLKIPLAKLADEDKKFIEEQAAAKPDAAATDVFKWETDYELAKKRAKDENKTILADFTGSDWCGWCIKLKKEVFDEPAFQEYAKKNLIMLELDFPHNKKLPSKVEKQNNALNEEFKVEGFPTVLLLDASGKEVGRTGYQAGGPEKYVEHVKGLLKK